MIVYRLERKGIGPFMGGSSRLGTKSPKKIKRMKHMQYQTSIFAFYSQHQNAVKRGQYVFGASSKELLKAYFAYNLKPLFQQGYKIHSYKVPDNQVINMGTEVAFPVRYHKLKNVDAVKTRLEELKLTSTA